MAENRLELPFGFYPAQVIAARDSAQPPPGSSACPQSAQRPLIAKWVSPAGTRVALMSRTRASASSIERSSSAPQREQVRWTCPASSARGTGPVRCRVGQHAGLLEDRDVR